MEIAVADRSMIEEICRVHFESWKVTYESYYPTALMEIVDLNYIQRIWLDAFEDVDRGQRVILVARSDCHIVGHIDIGYLCESPFFELSRLYIRTDLFRRGIGKRLLDAACEIALSTGRSQGMMWVVPDNLDARRFYEREGWHYANEHATIKGEGWTVPEMRYRKSFAQPPDR